MPRTKPGATSEREPLRVTRSGPKAIGALLPEISQARRGRGAALRLELARLWPVIAGPALAPSSLPHAVTLGRGGGTLTLKVRPGAALEFQHLSALLIERINRHFGEALIGEIKLIQGRLPEPPARRPPPPALDAAERAAIGARIAEIADDELKTALAGLASAVRGKAPPDPL